MEETNPQPEQKPKSEDNLKQIILGILVLCVIVYATFGLISKKFGWDVLPATVQPEKTQKTDNKTESLKTDSFPQPSISKNTEQEIDPSPKPRPVNKTPQKSEPPTTQTTESTSSLTASKTDEAKQAGTFTTLSGKWKTDNQEVWDVFMENDQVTIRVYDQKNKYKNQMTGQLMGKQLILDSRKPGSKGQGILSISDDGKTMRGKVKFILTFNNYIATRIDK